jgi:hypothetical protein
VSLRDVETTRVGGVGYHSVSVIPA